MFVVEEVTVAVQQGQEVGVGALKALHPLRIAAEGVRVEEGLWRAGRAEVGRIGEKPSMSSFWVKHTFPR